MERRGKHGLHFNHLPEKVSDGALIRHAYSSFNHEMIGTLVIAICLGLHPSSEPHMFLLDELFFYASADVGSAAPPL
jgi:hypothetical protein